MPGRSRAGSHRHRATAAAKLRFGGTNVVLGPLLSDVRVEQRPVGTRSSLERHADTAGVDDARAPERAVELGVRVATHDEALLDAGEHRPPAFLRRDGGQDLVVTSRRPVAEQGRAEPVDLDHHGLLEGGLEVPLPLVDHGGRPGRSRPLRAALIGSQCVELLDDPAIGVAAYEDRALPERAHELDRLPGQRPWHDIAADDDEIDVLALELGEDRAQRDEVAVDVGQGRDAHEADY